MSPSSQRVKPRPKASTPSPPATVAVGSGMPRLTSVAEIAAARPRLLSGDLIQTLLENDLVDELQLVTYPVTLGSGKRLFDRGTIPAAFTVSDGAVTPSGVVFARYTRAGDVVTGNVGPE